VIFAGLPFTANFVWFVASLAATLLYLLFAVTGFGRFYAALSLIATSSAFLALFNVLELNEGWFAAWSALHALVMVALHYSVGVPLLRRSYGPFILGWGAFWIAVTGLFTAYVLLPLDFDPAMPVWPIALTIVTLGVVLWRQPSERLSPLGLFGLILLFVPVFTRWAEGPAWSGGLATAIVTSGHFVYWRFRRATWNGRVALVYGVIGATIANFPPLYETAPGAGAATGLITTGLLAATAILTKQVLVVALPAITLAVGWWWVIETTGRLFPGLPRSTDTLANGYLALVVLVSALALALPNRWRKWGVAIGLAALAYASIPVVSTLSSPGAGTIVFATLAAVSALYVARWQVAALVIAPATFVLGFTVQLALFLNAPREIIAMPAVAAALVFSAVNFVWWRGGVWSAAFRFSGIGLAAAAFLVGLVVILELEGTPPRQD
ncbi:MAG: hypothetical protein NZ518_10205, partial [Dehalococcoidia bacterium]|nr:hypothetical protein [Dehalococcoidia bacterium]